MHSDIVLPKNNEIEFIEIASKLGIKKLCFLYDFDYYDEQKTTKKLESVKNYNNVSVETGFLVNQRNFGKAAKQSKLLVAKSSEKDRVFVESNKIKLIYGFEELYKKDYLHQRASGLNHVICELAKQNNVAISFSYSMLFDKNPAVASMLMGRMMQNIALCRKYKVKTAIGSFAENQFNLRSSYDVMSLFTMLGMSGEKIKESLVFQL